MTVASIESTFRKSLFTTVHPHFHHLQDYKPLLEDRGFAACRTVLVYCLLILALRGCALMFHRSLTRLFFAGVSGLAIFRRLLPTTSISL